MTRTHNEKYANDKFYKEWFLEVPFIKFPGHWEVRIVPPFSGALCRFHVKNGDDTISVYLDVDDTLGFVGEPYWEIYPYGDDVRRVLMNKTEQLISEIQLVLDGEDI